jgi:uncharacterized protein (DUF1501 family)
MKQRDEHAWSRRHFLRQSTCASMGITGIVSTLANLRLMNAAVAAQPLTDYKALICVFQNGGNDSNNFLIPSAGSLRTDYDAARGVLSIPANTLSTISPDNELRSFGLHPDCGELASLFNAGDLALISNVGSLSYPISNRDEYLNKLVPTPPQLFSHSNQQSQWQSSLPDKPFTSGWGGRLADLLNASYNGSGNASMSISLDGRNSFQVGTNGLVAQYALNPNGTTSLNGFGTNYSSALENDGITYKNSTQGWRLRGLEEVMRLTHENLLEDEYSDIVMTARDAESFIGTAITEAETAESNGGFTFDNLFTAAGATDTKLARELKMAARLIAGREAIGNNRQIFFVQTGGYDTHQVMLPSHSLLMDDLSHSVKGFWDSIKQLGLEDDVVVFSASDFNRTFTPNGTDASAGSDHAWGSHCFALGGPVKGKNMYGQFPAELKPGQGLDVGNNRGRWIPTTSVDQYCSVFAKWLGADSSSLETIFPNLSRFDDPFTSPTANLDFIDFTV